MDIDLITKKFLNDKGINAMNLYFREDYDIVRDYVNNFPDMAFDVYKNEGTYTDFCEMTSLKEETGISLDYKEYKRVSPIFYEYYEHGFYDLTPIETEIIEEIIKGNITSYHDIENYLGDKEKD